MTKRDDHVHSKANDDAPKSKGSGLSRRSFLKAGSGAVAAAAAATATLSSDGLGIAAAEARGRGHGGSHVGDYIDAARRRAEAFKVRRNAALEYLSGRPYVPQSNGDEHRYSDYRGQFHKCLPHDDIGEVDRSAYRAFVRAMDSAHPDDIEAVPLDPSAGRKLANPQAAYSFVLAGLDGHAAKMDPAPAFASAETAAEMGEVYWQALTRDVPFRRYDSSPLIQRAVRDLNAFSATVGPKSGGRVTSGTLFRGETPGDLIGPYISQFLWHDVPFGPTTTVQRYSTPVRGDDFMTDFPEWLAIQRGANPARSLTLANDDVYIHDGRSLGEYVHRDVLFQAYMNAALIMLSYGPSALPADNPYRVSSNQGGFSTFGGPFVLDLVTQGGNLGLKSAWHHKWLVHRRLRPEVFGGRLHLEMTNVKNYGIHSDILNSDAVGLTMRRKGSYLLPQAFPEGSPTHPSYPAGHATIAGCCCTLLKALFDEDFVIPNPVEASANGKRLLPWTGAPLTLGNEINKLANNISLGRDTAGVHYRSDGIDGVDAGEQQAIGLLLDYSLTFNEFNEGFTFTKFDGTRIQIVDGVILPA